MTQRAEDPRRAAPLSVLFLHRPALPSARVRILALIPHLEARGIECTARLHPDGPLSLRRLLRESESADVIVLQKKLPSLADGWCWRSRTAPLVFDFDDAIMFRQEPRRGSHVSGTRQRRFDRILALADGFVCGNDYLASFCVDTEKPVLVSASPVPLEVPQTRKRGERRPVRVGWIGSPGNLDSLAALAPALRRLAARRDFVLVINSEASLDLPGVSIEHMPWSLASQERDLASLDVGIMPLADTPWSRGKCAYKLLQYMAAALPVVASPVGMNTQVLVDGENGLAATSEDQWVEALTRLVCDPALSERLGACGRRTAERYGYPAAAARWDPFLRRLARPQTSVLDRET